VLWVMWFFHLRLFLADDFTHWLGFLVVVHQVWGSLFNSFLFDFTEGWLYIFGIGVLGGMVRAGCSVLPVDK